MVSSRLDYCNSLHMALPMRLTLELQLVQNAAAQNPAKSTHSTCAICSALISDWAPYQVQEPACLAHDVLLQTKQTAPKTGLAHWQIANPCDLLTHGLRSNQLTQFAIKQFASQFMPIPNLDIFSSFYFYQLDRPTLSGILKSALEAWALSISFK